jgi:hypothetical protein
MKLGVYLHLGLVVSAIAGCERPYEGPQLLPVVGTVTIDGKPLSNAALQFVATGDTKGLGGAALTDGEGKFKVTTPDGAHTGLAAGDYSVVISKLVNPDGTDFIATPDLAPMDANAKELLPSLYSDPAESTLAARVRADSPPLEFRLNSQ